MGWDGNGNYTRVHNFSADSSAGIKILAARMDAEIDDFASAIQIAWARDGQNVPTANIPMGGKRFVNVGAPTSVSNFMRVREFIENVPIFMTDAESSADRISVSAQYFTSVSANQAPGDGTKIIVRTGSNKTSAALYLNGHSANVKFQDGNAIDGALVSGGIYEFTYSSTESAWKVGNPDDGRNATERANGITPTNYKYEFGDVRRYGAIGDGTTNDTTAIQNACTAVGVAGKVIFPAAKVFRCDGTLTIPNFQTWVGVSYEPGAGGAQASIYSSLTSGRFITTGVSPTFENIRFLGAITYTDATGATSGSTTICLTLADAVTLKNCVFQLQSTCIETSAAYYIRVWGGEIVRCGLFLNMVTADVFNMELDGVIFRLCSVVTSSNDTPTRYVHNLKVNGGSFESWTALFNSVASASFFGTYFESDIAGGFGFNSDSSFTDVVCINLFGCFIFLNNLNRFVNFSGLTAGTFVSIGNLIAGSSNTGQNQYYFVPQTSGGRVVMLGDYLDDRGTGTFQGSYTSDNTKLYNQMVVWPSGTTANHANYGQTWVDGGIVSKPTTLANSATPTVAGGSNFLTGGTTTITNFTNGVEGQIIHVLSEHAITITDGTNIFLSGSVNFSMNSTDTLTLICKADGKWYEIGRSDNT